ncbi:MAG TPA: WD40 repeat domain-containing protein [Rhizomicrobium sp.]|nr:WD40 repeat domain-containing protein [Rhizomicrobium sp.]
MVATGSAKPFIERVLKVAKEHYGAPTLDELALSFAARSPIRWSQEAYAQRLQELTGLPRHQPLPLLGTQQHPVSEAMIAIAYALAQIETPGRVPHLSETRTAFNALINSQTEKNFEAEALAIGRGKGSTLDAASVHAVKDTLMDLADERDAAATGVAAVRNNASAKAKTNPNDLPQRVRSLVKGDSLERSLAIYPDKELAQRFPGRPWVSHDSPSGAEIAPQWAPWAAGAVPLLIAFYWFFNSAALRKAYLRRRPPEFPPLHMDLAAEAAAHKHASAALFHRIGQRLQRRTARPSSQIDIDATVRASIEAGGMLVVPQFARTRAASEYLVLIDRAGANDQNAEYLRSLVLKIRELVTLEVFFYQSEPSMLEPDEGGAPVPIERLQATYPFHRLLILGSGAEFLDPVSRELLPGAEKLAFWERRALLTPLPVAEWAQEEYLLARSLAMPIGRATPEGLMALAEMFGLEGIEYDALFDRSGDGLAQPLPDLLRLRTQQYLYSAPPSDHPLEQIVQDLRNYLDAPAFDWLCALAVYPAIQWDLTLHLGLTLAEKPGGDAARRPLYREDRIAALTQLPWLRSGRMPNWLRRVLIGSLKAGRAGEVRVALERLIEAARSTGDVARDGNIHIRIGREPRKERLEPKTLFDDEVLLDFMAKGEIEDFRLPNAQFLSRFLPEAWMHRFGWPELMVAAVAGLYAAAAWLLTPKAGAALITGAWLPLAALAMGALAFGAIAASEKIYAALRAFAGWLTPFALAATFVFLGSLLLSDMYVMRWRPPGLPDIKSMTDFAIWALVFLLPLGGAEAVTEFYGLRGGRVVSRMPSRVLARAAGFALFCFLALTLTVDDDAAGPSDWRWSRIAAIAFVVFIAGVFARRFAPERLTPFGARSFMRFGAATILALGLLALLPLGPAFLLRSALGAAHADIPGSGDTTAPADAQLLAVSPDGRFFATGNASGEVRTFAASDPGKPLSTIRLEGGRVTALAVRKPEMLPLRVAAATLEHRTLLLFDGTTGRKLGESIQPWAESAQSRETDGTVTAAAIGPDGGTAFVQEDGSGVPFIVNGADAIAVQGHGAVTALASAGVGQFLYGALDGTIGVLAKSNGTLALRDAPAIQSPANVPAFALPGDRAVTSAAYSPISNQFAIGYADGGVDVRDGASGKTVFILAPPTTNRMEHVFYSPDGSLLLTISIDGRVRTWDSRTGKVLTDRTAPIGQGPLTAALSGNNRAIGILSGQKLIFCGGSGAATCEVLDSKIPAFLFVPPGTLTLIVDRDGKLRPWKPVGTWSSQVSGIRGVVLSHDGSEFLTWSDGGIVNLSDINTGKLLRALQPVGGDIIDASISGDGTRVAAGVRHGNDPATVVVWDAFTGGIVLSFTPYQADALAAVRLSPDAKRLLTAAAGKDKPARMWDLSKVSGDYKGGVAIRSIQIDDSFGIPTGSDVSLAPHLSWSAKKTVAPGQFEDIEIRDTRNQDHPIVYRAKRADFAPMGDIYRLVMKDGVITQLDMNGAPPSTLKFASYIFDLSQFFGFRFTAVTTDGAILHGALRRGVISRIDFAGRDARLAMGPAVGWQAAGAQPQQQTGR